MLVELPPYDLTRGRIVFRYRNQPRSAGGPDLVLSETGVVICRRRTPCLVNCSKRMCRPAQRYGEVGRCGERSTSRVISLGAKTRNGGPQKPVPRLV